MRNSKQCTLQIMLSGVTLYCNYQFIVHRELLARNSQLRLLHIFPPYYTIGVVYMSKILRSSSRKRSIAIRSELDLKDLEGCEIKLYKRLNPHKASHFLLFTRNLFALPFSISANTKNYNQILFCGLVRRFWKQRQQKVRKA